MLGQRVAAHVPPRGFFLHACLEPFPCAPPLRPSLPVPPTLWPFPGLRGACAASGGAAAMVVDAPALLPAATPSIGGTMGGGSLPEPKPTRCMRRACGMWLGCWLLRCCRLDAGDSKGGAGAGPGGSSAVLPGCSASPPAPPAPCCRTAGVDAHAVALRCRLPVAIRPTPPAAMPACRVPCCSLCDSAGCRPPLHCTAGAATATSLFSPLHCAASAPPCPLHSGGAAAARAAAGWRFSTVQEVASASRRCRSARRRLSCRAPDPITMPSMPESDDESSLTGVL